LGAVTQATKRRVWACPELSSHSLLVLTADRLYLAPAAAEPKPETLATIQSGGDLEQLLGPLAITIDLVSVRRVKLDLLSNSLVVEYLGRGHETSRAVITFASHEAADACFTKLWRRLGDGMRLGDQTDKWALARGPLVLLLASLVATAALALVLSVFEDFESARVASKAGAASATGPLGQPVEAIPKTPLEALIGWMNWKVICAIGGIVAAASQVWLYRRLTTPPVSLELARDV